MRAGTAQGLTCTNRSQEATWDLRAGRRVSVTQVRVWQQNPHHGAEVLELVLQASEEVAVVGVHAHLPQLVVVRAVAFVDAALLQTRARSQLQSRHGATHSNAQVGS